MKISWLFQQSALYFIGNIVRRGVGFLMIPVYTKFLTPADYGLIEMIELFVSVSVIILGVLAMNDAMVRIYYDYPDERSRGTLVSTALVGITSLSLLLAGAAFIGATPLAVLMFGSASSAWLVRLAFLAMVLGNITELALVYSRIKQRSLFFVLFSAAQLALTLALNIWFIAYRGMGVWGFVLSKLICTGLGAAILVVLLLRETGFGFNWEQARRMAHFGAPLVITSACFFVIHFADRFFLNHFVNLGEVGVYALAYKAGFLVTYIVGEPFARVWAVSLYAHTSTEGWRHQFGRIARYFVLALFLVAVGISVVADEAVPLVAAPAYAQAAMLIPFIAFAYVFREIGDFFRDLLFINKRSGLFSRITIVCALLNIGLDYWLIQKYQMKGAALATLLTWLAYMAGCWIAAQHEHRIVFAFRSVALLGILSAVVLFASKLIGEVAMLGRIGIDILLVFGFALVAWLIGYFPAEEKAMMRSFLSQRRRLLVKAVSHAS